MGPRIVSVGCEVTVGGGVLGVTEHPSVQGGGYGSVFRVLFVARKKIGNFSFGFINIHITIPLAYASSGQS